jgi:hypothetical protein
MGLGGPIHISRTSPLPLLSQHLALSSQLHPFAGALFDRRGESGLRDDDVAAEREDFRLVLVRVDHRDLIGPAQRLYRWLFKEIDVNTGRPDY